MARRKSKRTARKPVRPKRKTASRAVIGVDIGGSSIKCALVNVRTGALLDSPAWVPTPQPATPTAVAEAVNELVRPLPRAPMGITYPGVVHHGRAMTAANIDARWIGTDMYELFGRATGHKVVVLNDADAAGIAEMRLGAGRNHSGTVLALTFGTGIGSALFIDGIMVPNTEFGHLDIDGRKAEHIASGRVRSAEGLNWEQWAARVNEVLAAYYELLAVELFILSGGVVENFSEFAQYLESPAEIVPARFGAQAGIVGAALAAARSR